MAAKNSSPANEDEDRTAQLPTPLLAHILSLLPLRAALLCGTLSKSFLAARRELLAVAVLDFGSDFAGSLPLERYSSAVDGIISLHEAQTLDCLKICLPKYLPAGELLQLQSHLESWLRFAASKRVRMFQLDCPVRPKEISVQLFHQTAVTHLSLSRCAISASLLPLQVPSLQALSLREVCIFDDELGNLLRCCPLLSALKLTKCDYLSDVRIFSTKCLSCLTIIDCRLHSIRIYTQTLQSFYFFGSYSCTVFFYREDVTLRDVYISNIKRHASYRDYATFCYFSLLAQITTLTLSDSYLKSLYGEMGVWSKLMGMAQPSFCSLKNLRIIGDEYFRFVLLCNVLQSCNFPSLENLFIEFVKVAENKFNTKDILLPFDKLRFMSIIGFQGFESEMTIVKLFLERAMSLETVLLVMAEPFAQDKIAALRRKLNVISKASPDAQIVLCGAGDVPANLPLCPHAELHSEILGYY